MLERCAGRLTVVVEHEDILEARILLEIAQTLAKGDEHVGDGRHRERREGGGVLRCLDHDLVGAHAVHPVEETFAGRLELALDPERRELVRHHPVRPAGLVRATPGTPAGENLGRGLVLVTGAEDAFGSDRPHGLGDEVGRPPRPLGGDDHPAADDRILPELGQRSVGGGLDGPLRGRGKRSREGANPQEGLRGQSPRSDGGYSYVHLALLFASQGPLEERGQRLRRRLALEEHRADLLADGHAHGVATRERERRGDRPRPLGDHAGLPLDGGDRLAEGERYAELAVARETPGAREDEVAQARESREGRGRSAERDGEPCHLGEPARDERGAGVLAEAEPVDEARRDRHHVLQRPARLDADDVTVRVESKLARAERALEGRGQPVVAATPPGMSTSGRYQGLRRRTRIPSTTSGSRAQRRTAPAFFARWIASAVPQLPPPTMEITGAGSARPAYSVGGLPKARPGYVRLFPSRRHTTVRFSPSF